MNLMPFVFSCFLTLHSIQGHYWTGWYDRDDPSGYEDNEHITEQKKLGYICGGCKPIAAECRVKGSTSTFTRWSGTAPDILEVHCLPTQGLLCRNSQQADGSCADYEIRYLCPSTSGTWTNYQDRDDPSGTGDWENVETFRSTDNVNLCNGARPLCTRCRDRVTHYHYYATGDQYNTDHDCNWENGLVCTTSVNGRTCKDYEVNFKCPNIGTCLACAKWTPWMDRDDPSGDRDAEHVGPTGFNPCSGHEPIDIQCRTRGNNVPWELTGQVIKVKCTPSEGFVCENRDQPSGQNCFDYEVRFLCP
ncbi:mucin-5AC-like [Lingula anatina]|uniref:Mucin-5AC-like n=1 Tax=Lingula anatina TaxID=7574 RepID=A0A1S3IR02_LINAN|nr:mucin-5AC-like [Lingula anatina]|eukprot:XP_013400493.1 mucin-5AC-like [Lingula anatina]